MKRIQRVLVLSLAVAATGRAAEETAGASRNETALAAARAKESAGDLYGALAILEKAVAGSPAASPLRRLYGDINKRILLTDVRPPGTEYYTVRPGDTLTRIAQKHAITVGLLRRLNGLTDDSLQVKQKLKVVRGPFSVRVVKSAFVLEVCRGDTTLFTYPVGLGKDNSTPTGTYTVGAKLVKPTQFDREKGRKIPYGDPEHTIGTRWITISGQYGIHGTVEPESIGKEESRGCVRMLNRDVEQLYDLLVKGKSKATIVE